MRKILFLTTLLAFVLTSSAWAGDVSGNWTIKLSGPQGEDSIDAVIKAAGGNLTITGTHATMGDKMTGTGILKGDDIVMNIKSETMGLEFIFTGKVANNKMSGTRDKIDNGRVYGSAKGQDGGQGGQGGGQVDLSKISNAWTAERK